jgi:hypothetical protein
VNSFLQSLFAESASSIPVIPKLSASVRAEHDCSKVLPATFWFRESTDNELLLQNGSEILIRVH